MVRARVTDVENLIEVVSSHAQKGKAMSITGLEVFDRTLHKTKV